MKKKTVILLAALILSYGCARPLTAKEKNIPPPLSAQAIWVYGHYDSQGIFWYWFCTSGISRMGWNKQRRV